MKILSFTISYRGKRGLGLGVCSFMVACLLWIVLEGGLLDLVEFLVVSWRLASVGILLIFLMTGLVLRSSPLGLVVLSAASQEFEAGVGSRALSAVVWSGMRSLVSGVVGLGFLPCLHRS